MKNTDNFSVSYIRVTLLDGEILEFGDAQTRDEVWYLGFGEKFIEVVSNSNPHLSLLKKQWGITRNYIPIEHIKKITTEDIRKDMEVDND